MPLTPPRSSRRWRSVIPRGTPPWPRLLALLVGVYARSSPDPEGSSATCSPGPCSSGTWPGILAVMTALPASSGRLPASTSRATPSWRTSACSRCPGRPIGLTVAVLLLVLTPRFPRLPGLVMLAATAVVAIFDLTAVGVDTVVRGVVLRTPRRPADARQRGRRVDAAVFVVGYTDNILTARAFAGRTHSRVHNNQEFLAMAGNGERRIILVGGFPVSSSARPIARAPGRCTPWWRPSSSSSRSWPSRADRSVPVSRPRRTVMTRPSG